MYKTVYVLLVMGCLLLLSSTAIMAQSHPPRTQTVHSINDFAELDPPVVPPIIDGFFESGDAWTYSSQAGPSADVTARSFWWIRHDPALDTNDLVPSGVIEGDDEPIDANDLSYRVWMMYDDTYLYVAVEVLDDFWVSRVSNDTEDTSADGELQHEDSVEIYIDGDHSRSPADLTQRPEEYATGGQFVYSADRAWRDVNAGDPSFGPDEDDDWYAQSDINAAGTGFVYEFRFKLSKIGNPQAGDIIGFNIGVNDADFEDDPTRRYQLRWVGETFDESTYGDLHFGRKQITAPLISEAISIDGELSEGVWQNSGKGEMSPYLSPFWQAAYPRDADDHSATIHVLHDETYLYIATDVRDDIITVNSGEANMWEDDAVEFMIDGNLSYNPGSEDLYGSSVKITIAADGTLASYNNTAFFYGDAPDDDYFSAA
ncbi:MAG: sugar-binding protein, partial [bacterium]